MTDQDPDDPSGRVEDVAQQLHRLYAKHTEPYPPKWQHIPADKRSLWRMIARAALSLTFGGS